MFNRTRFSLFLILYFLIVSISKGQKTDSLLNVLKSAKEDTNKVKLLNAIASSLNYNDPLKAIKYAKEALVLAKKYGHIKEQIRSYFNLGQFQSSLGNYKEAEKNLNKADSLSLKINYIQGSAVANAQMAVIYFQKEQYSEALECRLKALKIYEAIKDKRGESAMVGNIASIYGMLRQYDLARNYFTRALKLKQELGDRRGESIICLNMATSYYDQTNWVPAMEYFEKCLHLQKDIGDAEIIANCKSNLGNLFAQTREYARSQKLHQESFEFYKQLADTSSMARSLKDIGDLKRRMGDYKGSVKYGEQALELIEHTENKTPLKSIYAVLSGGYSGLKDYKKALLYYGKAVDMERITYTDEMAQKIAKQKEQYESEKKEQDILLLKQQNAVTNAVSEKRKLWIITICSFATVLLLGLILIVAVNRNRKKQKELEFVKTKAELEQTALLAQMNPHFIFNALNSIQHYILSKETEYAYDYLAKFSKLIRQVLMNSEQNTIALNREIETLQLYIELEQRRLKNRFDFEINYADNFPAHDITIPTMLIQPFVENAIWHGVMNMPEEKKGKIVLNFSLTGKQLKISVVDNGVGRKEAALRKVNNEYKSIGVMFTQKRLELLKAVSKQESEIIITDLADVNGKATGTKVEIIMEITA